MICNFYHDKSKLCVNSYCYYATSREIDCPVKKEYAAETAQLKIPDARRSVKQP